MQSTKALMLVVCTFGIGACWGHKHHHHGEPDSGSATSSDSQSTIAPISCGLIEEQVEEDDNFPEGACAPNQQTCLIGDECCCGRCFANVVCRCDQGNWACYFTDICNRPDCPEGGIPDAHF